MPLTLSGSTGIAGVDGSAGTPAVQGTDTNTGIAFPAADTVAIGTGGSERMRVDSSGNVGIGTSSPGTKLEVAGVGMFRTGTNDFIQVLSDSGAMEICRAAGEAYIDLKSLASEDWDVRLQSVGTGGTFSISTNGSERARITSDGQFFVDTTTNDTSSRISTRATSAVINGVGVYCTTTAATGAMVFFNPNGQVGTIQVTGSATAYITSSDYRLKENVAPITNGLTTIASLKPVTYDWKNDASKGEGFIAHELQSVIPAAVSGEKDAINKDGSINPQGVDYSKIVVHLVAAIQELKAENDDLKARLTALEAK